MEAISLGDDRASPLVVFTGLIMAVGRYGMMSWHELVRLFVSKGHRSRTGNLCNAGCVTLDLFCLFVLMDLRLIVLGFPTVSIITFENCTRVNGRFKLIVT